MSDENNAVSLDDFVFDMAVKLSDRFESVDVMQSFAFASVKIWAYISQNVSIEDQDGALEALFDDMREIMAQCQRNLKNPDLN